MSCIVLRRHDQTYGWGRRLVVLLKLVVLGHHKLYRWWRSDFRLKLRAARIRGLSGGDLQIPVSSDQTDSGDCVKPLKEVWIETKAEIAVTSWPVWRRCDLRLKLRAARFWGLSRGDLETEVESQRRHEFDEPDPVTNAVNPFKEVLTERRIRKGRKKVINGQVRD